MDNMDFSSLWIVWLLLFAIAMSLPSKDEKRAPARRLIFIALVTLALLYILKFFYPHHSIIALYPASSSSEVVSSPSSVKGTSIPKLSAPSRNLYAEAANALYSRQSNDSDRVAVLIDPAFRLKLVPLIVHYTVILGPAWPILVYTSPEAASQFSSSAALNRYIALGAVQIRLLPQAVLLTNTEELNKFMTGPWLWENLAPAEHILLFQSDSTLCGNAARSVEHFLEWDFLGASTSVGYGRGEMGLSLSLRKRSSMIRVLDGHDRWDTKSKLHEDEWFLER